MDGESLNAQDPISEPIKPAVPGGGAGSGGTIILSMYSLIGKGVVSANGGRGGPVGGGGGGGELCFFEKKRVKKESQATRLKPNAVK